MNKLSLIFIATYFFISTNVSAQFSKEFNKKEAVDMIALCNSFTFLKVYNNDKAIAPQGYSKDYQSGVIGLGNQWQMWRHKDYAVINLRGSTSDQISWMANMYSAMIPAKGTIILPGEDRFSYQLSENPKANIHSGWMLSTAFLSKDIIQHIKMLNYEGVYHFIITGHSQGAAIAQLLRAYLESQPNSVVNSKNQFKTYAFASPMVGNIAFSESYNQRFYKSSFTINNPEDAITKMPFTIDKKNMLDLEEISSSIIGGNTDYFKTFAYRALGKVAFNDPDSAYVEKAGINVHQQLAKDIGPFKMPTYQLDMNYKSSGQHILIGPFHYGEIANKTYTKKLGITEDSNFLQHKPYLYFLYLTKKYFPNRF